MDTFEGIIGQEGVVSHLQNALRTGSISHAYILNGETGTGRRTIARTFAATLACASPEERNGLLEPCGKCLSCLQAASGSQPDIITIRKESEGKKGGLGVDVIRQMRSDIQVRPYAGNYKIYIVEDAHRMTVQAQNALLKILEEPPAYAVILLIADGLVNFLPTILSRCIVLQIRLLPRQEIVKALLERTGADRDRALITAGSVGGNLGRALQLCSDDRFLALRQQTVGFLRSIQSRRAEEITEFCSGIDGESREDFLRFVRMWYRDLLVCKETLSTAASGAEEGSTGLLFEEEVQYIKENAQRLSYESLSEILLAQETAAKRLKANVNPETVIRMMLLTIREAERTG